MKIKITLKAFMSILMIFAASAISAQSIYDIQFTEDSSGDSPEMDNVVTTTGIVTATSDDGYWLQDGEGPWNGIFVFDFENFPFLGDEITVTGTVQEFFGLTEIAEVTAYTVDSSANTLPAPTIATTEELNEEAYEGCYILVEVAECTDDDAGYGQWIIDDGSGPVFVDDVIFNYSATTGESYSVTGVMSYAFSERKILPRSADDISVVTSVQELNEVAFNVFPNPVSDVLNISVDTDENFHIEIYSLDGRLVHSETVNTTNHSLDCGNLLSSGMYNVIISNQEFSVNKLIEKK